MNPRLIKIGKILIALAVFYFLGYTHLLGGPFWLARFLFAIMGAGVIIFSIFLWRVKILSKKVSQKSNEKETIKVDVKIIE